MLTAPASDPSSNAECRAIDRSLSVRRLYNVPTFFLGLVAVPPANEPAIRRQGKVYTKEPSSFVTEVRSINPGNFVARNKMEEHRGTGAHTATQMSQPNPLHTHNTACDECVGCLAPWCSDLACQPQ